MVKTISGLSFSINAVVEGQKSSAVNAAPQLIANSTVGKFVITAPVSKALNIAVGEHVMFLNNLSDVETAIQERNEALVQYATENGIDLDTKEGCDAILATFGQWYIAKGAKLYDSKGNPVEASVRFSKEDKQKFLEMHADEILEANREALIEQFGELSDEELKAKLNVDMVESPKYHACRGSKTSTTSSATGVGVQLSFTDTAIWGALKADLGDNAPRKNRIFDVKLDDVVKTQFNNGKEVVTVSAYPIEFVEDTDPIVREAKNDAE